MVVNNIKISHKVKKRIVENRKKLYRIWENENASQIKID